MEILRSGDMRIMMIVGGSIVAVLVAIMLIRWAVPDSAPIVDALIVIQAFVTVVAIVGGAILAYQRFQLFRTFYPHLSIKHSIRHRRLSENFLHISVMVVMQNTSRVQVEIRESFALVQEVAPIPDRRAEERSDSAWKEDADPTFDWPIVARLTRKWSKNELIVEPGERHSETLEFIVDRAGVYIDNSQPQRTVLIYTYFKNEDRRKKRQSARGWAATTVYDVEEESRQLPKEEGNHAGGS